MHFAVYRRTCIRIVRRGQNLGQADRQMEGQPGRQADIHRHTQRHIQTGLRDKVRCLVDRLSDLITESLSPFSGYKLQHDLPACGYFILTSGREQIPLAHFTAPIYPGRNSILCWLVLPSTTEAPLLLRSTLPSSGALSPVILFTIHSSVGRLELTVIAYRAIHLCGLLSVVSVSGFGPRHLVPYFWSRVPFPQLVQWLKSANLLKATCVTRETSTNI